MSYIFKRSGAEDEQLGLHVLKPGEWYSGKTV